MFPSPLVTLGLATIGAYAKPTVRAAGGLEVSLSTPADNIASVSDVRIVATVKNVGDEDLKVLKFGTVLDNEHPARSFIVSKDGKDVPFIGTTVPPPTDQLSENDWVVIQIGNNVTVEHEVSSLYDLSASGPGTFTFDPVSRFQVIGLDGSVETTPDTSGTNVINGHSTSTSIIITDLSKRELNLSKRIVSCDLGTRILNIERGITEAETLASTAVSYIKSKGVNDQLYKAYFGNNRISAVVENFNSIRDADLHKLTIYCTDPTFICDTIDYDAHTIGPSHSVIYYCNSFFGYFPLISLCRDETSVNAREIFGGTTLRMFTYSFVWGMDYGGGHSCEDSQGLSDQDKIKNSDNYECFAAQVYKNTKC